VFALLTVNYYLPFYQSGLPYRLLLTCEHASQLMPSPWRWPDEDRRLLNTHWALDLGSEGLCSLNVCAVRACGVRVADTVVLWRPLTHAELTRELSAAVAAPAVIAQFSRLLVDANRPLDSPTLFRDVADGQPVHLNQGTHRGRK
jgi:predicted N-formylglutamate amidohydrolase